MSNILGSMLFNASINSEANAKTEFITKYGSYADKYDKINNLGEQKRIWPYLISVLLFIGIIICYIYSKEEIDKTTNEPKPKTKSQKIISYIGYVFLGLFILSILYNGAYYIFYYYPQYRQWHASLPAEAIPLLKKIDTLETVSNLTRSSYYNRPPPV